MIDDDLILKVEKEAIERYSKRFKNLGISPRSLGWGCKEDQLERFRVIAEQCNLENKSIMDLGCGFADLFVYLREHDINVNYIGVDIVPDFINYCNNEFPKLKFYNKNVMTQFDELPQADVVISLGTLNFRMDNDLNFEYSKFFIKKAYKLTKEILIVDFLSEYRTPDYPKEDFVCYHLPEDVFKFVMLFAYNVKIIHNYKPIPQKEFMIIIEKKKEESK